jgi:adenosyl cobinamide kinase/adenosyl cobinamide phosphate guanylyltransferase
MCTAVYQRDLYPDIWVKNDIAKALREQAGSVQRQVDNGCDKIEIHLLGIELHLEYDEDSLSIVT